MSSQEQTAHAEDEPLDVSVVFATRDRCEQLAETLDAYMQLNLEGVRWELMVVDNGSTDATGEVLERMSERLPLRTLQVTSAGQNRARNEALAHLKGRLIVFTDDDAVPAPNCLHAYLQAAARWPDDAIFGARIKPRFPAGTPVWLASDAFDFGTTAFARYCPGDDEGPVKRHPYGPSFAVRAHVIGDLRFPEHIGPQAGNYAMGGEGVFLRALSRRGHRYIYVPSAQVEHVIRPEQVQDEWLLRRANKKGRGQAYMPRSGRPYKVHLAGAPLRLWMAVVRSWLRLRLMTADNAEKTLEQGITYQRRLGELQQRRLITREQK